MLRVGAHAQGKLQKPGRPSRLLPVPVHVLHNATLFRSILCAVCPADSVQVCGSAQHRLETGNLAGVHVGVYSRLQWQASPYRHAFKGVTYEALLAMLHEL